MKQVGILFFIGALLIAGCKKNEETPSSTTTGGSTATQPSLIFKFKFDSTQQRLNNIGQPSTIPAGHAAQSPVFNKMSAHYIELAPSAFTGLGAGAVLYKNTETTAGGTTAIDFEKSVLAGNGETFFSIPLKNVPAGNYQYIRVSLAYQNYDVKVRVKYNNQPYDFTGTIASFIGYNTYIKTYSVKTKSVSLNANKLQGYWAFEAQPTGTVTQGQAPPGATTVPNPIFASSPVPQGSCVVTGPFANALTITGNETKDIVITVSLSTNKSFEWKDFNTNNLYEPADGDTVVDMGIRGLIPYVN